MSIQTIQTTQLDSGSVIICPGQKLDNENASDMSIAISTAQLEGILDIRIDMSELLQLSSAGIGSILGAVEVTREAGGDISIWNVPDKIRNVLDILDLGEYLTVKSGEPTQPAS
jgi:anti-anti-sigma factor